MELSLSPIDILVKTSPSGWNATFSISTNNVSAFVHKSGSNIRLAGQLLLDNFFMTNMGGTLKHVLGIQFSCVSGLEIRSIEIAIAAARCLVTNFRKSEVATTALRKRQEQMQDEQHNLVQDVVQGRRSRSGRSGGRRTNIQPTNPLKNAV